MEVIVGAGTTVGSSDTIARLTTGVGFSSVAAIGTGFAAAIEAIAMASAAKIVKRMRNCNFE